MALQEAPAFNGRLECLSVRLEMISFDLKLLRAAA